MIERDFTQAKTAQDSLDLLGDQFLDEALYLPAEAMVHESLLQSIAQGKHPDSTLAIVYDYLGTLYQFNAMFDSAKSSYMNSIRYQRAAGKDDLIMGNLSGLSNCYQEEGDLKKSVNLSYEAIRMAEAKKDTAAMIALNFNLGNTFTMTRDTELGEKHYNRALRLSQQSESDHVLPNIMLGLASLAGIKEDYKLAKTRFMKCLVLFEEIGDEILLSNAYSNLAVCYQLGEQKWDSAVVMLKKAYNIDKKRGHPGFLANSTLSLANAYVQIGEVELAKPYQQEALALYENHNLDQTDPEIYRLLSEMSRDMNNYKAAYKYALGWKSLSDSLMSLDFRVEAAELDKKYQNEKDARRIFSLQKEGEETRQNMFLWRLGLIGGILALGLVLFAVVVFFRKRRSDQIRASLALENRLLQSQMNPHFLFNSLNTIRSFHLQGEMGKADSYLVQFSQMLRGVLEHSHHNQVTLADDLKTLEDYMQIERLRFDDGFEYEIEVDEVIEAELLHVPPMVIQPFVENAILHGMQPAPGLGKLKIQISEISDQQIKCVILDNGIGVDISLSRKGVKSHPSRGIEIARNRLGGDDRMSIEQLMTPEGMVAGTAVTLIMDVSYD